MRVARVVLVAALLLGACNGGNDEDDGLPPRPSSTDTTAPDYSVPAVIDVAYVEKVMAALDHVYGDGIRALARERTITQEFLEHLRAVYTPSEFEVAQDVWVKDVAAGLQGLLPNPGDPRTTIARLIRNERSCVVAAVTRSFAATRSAPDKVTPPWYIALISKPDERPLNPTPWILAFDGFKDDGSEPKAPCAL
jgi:hypothetical protein